QRALPGCVSDAAPVRDRHPGHRRLFRAALARARNRCRRARCPPPGAHSATYAVRSLMRFQLAALSLRRHASRTLLAVLGVAVSAAMLLDMVMLATGMRQSFASLLGRNGFTLRVSPRGTWPFDTEATIAQARDATIAMQRIAGVAAVAPVLGTTIHVLCSGSPSTR